MTTQTITRVICDRCGRTLEGLEGCTLAVMLRVVSLPEPGAGAPEYEELLGGLPNWGVSGIKTHSPQYGHLCPKCTASVLRMIRNPS
jgi:hypothetical protein